MIDHLRDALHRQRDAVIRALRVAHARKQQAHIVMYFGNGADGGARVMRSRFLLYGYGGRQPLYQIDVGFFHQLQKLARIRRERFHIAPLAFRIQGVERERRLAGPGQAGDDDQFVSRQIKTDVFEIVRTRTANFYKFHRLLPFGCS